MFVVGTFITKAPGVAAKAEAAFWEVQHLLHDADTDGREVARASPGPQLRAH